MSDPQTTPPILVTPSAAPGATMTAIRDLLKVVGMGLATHGVIEAQYVEPLVGALLIIGPVLWSQYVTWRNHQKLRTLEPYAPSDVARLK